ncbi:hypothetical protein H0H92_014580, partial [Tricholoma furcatifolium]
SSIGRARQALLNLDDGVDVANEFEGDDPFSSPIGRLFDLPLDNENPPVGNDIQTEDEELPGDGDEAEESQDSNPFPDPLPRVRPRGNQVPIRVMQLSVLMPALRRNITAKPTMTLLSVTHVQYSSQKNV